MTKDDIALIDSDGEINDTEHSKLLAAVTQLEGKHRVKPSVRREPTTEISEFHLVKSGSLDQDAVRIHELAQALESHMSHNDIAQKIRATKKHGKTLPKPVEKPEANRIDRSVRYENVKDQLSRWDAIVHSNRLSDRLSFPLNQPTLRLQSSTEFLKKFKPQTPLEIEIAEILAEGKPPCDDKDKEESEYPLTLEEMMERREELIQLRAKQWNRESKAARQKKIKSKKYHRILRREKIKEQLKEFEALKKTNPEAALERLEQLDKTRAEERASLRHRSTGQWARNRAVRAKYDKESRQVLAQQLSVSRELTQKVRKEDSDDDDDDENSEIQQSTVTSSDNPWVDNGLTASAEVTDFVSGYRKYWQNKVNERGKIVTKSSVDDVVEGSADNECGEIVSLQRKGNELSEDSTTVSVIAKKDKDANNSKMKTKIDNDFKVKPRCSESGKRSNSKKKLHKAEFEKCITSKKKLRKTKPKVVATTPGWTVYSIDEESEKISPERKEKKQNSSSCSADELSEKFSTRKKKLRKTKSKVVATTSGWTVYSAQEQSEQTNPPKKAKKKRVSSLSVDELFDDIDKKLQNKLNKKIKRLKQKVHVDNANEVPERSDENNSGKSLAFKKVASRPVIDEVLHEGTNATPSVQEDPANFVAINYQDSLDKEKTRESNGKSTVADVDPNQFLSIKPKHLKSHLPDLSTMGEEALDDETEKHVMITEAFAEDDVVVNFRKEKEEIVNASKEKNIELDMPGWGQWGGKNLPTYPRKKKCMILKKPIEPPRKDSNKGDVIINQQKDKKIKEHLVNALPFPFTSVKSFEASIRAPIGNTWVPATSFWQLTTPEVESKLGAIIEPMDENQLINYKSKDKKWTT